MHTTTNIYVFYHATNFTFPIRFSLLSKHVSADALYIDTSMPFYFQFATPLPDLLAAMLVGCYGTTTKRDGNGHITPK